MSKKLILVFVVVFLLFGFKLARANVVISEIMYNPAQDDDYNEWIELYNNGEEIDLTNLLVCGKSIASGYIKHSDNSLNQDNGLTLGANKFVIITDGGSGTDVLIPTGILALHVDSSTMCGGLSNNEDTVSIAGPGANSVGYTFSQGAAGDGNSLQLMADGTWKACEPTPGSATLPSCGNSNSSGDGGGSSGGGSNDGGNSGGTSGSSSGGGATAEPKNKTAPVALKIRTQITAKTLAYVGIPFLLEGMAFGTDGQRLFIGKYFWNFGDGDSRETPVTNNEKILHTYFYPGDYTVLFEYYPNTFTDTPDAFSQITIKVVPASISISRVGDAKDFFVELANNTGYNADLSNWSLTSATKKFTIPKNTILAPKKTLIISPRITNFSIEDKNTLKLINPEREVAFDYTTSPQPLPKREGQNITQLPKSPLSRGLSNSSYLGKEKLGGMKMEATAINSGTIETETKNSSSSMLFVGIFLLFVGASAGGVYFIRQKKFVPQIGNDFEILDE